MGRWSRLLAPRFVDWLRIAAGAHWLEVGCGTGALTSAICDRAEPASITACDPAESFIEYARRHCGDTRVSFAVAGAGNLPPRKDGYGSVTSLLALNFLPDATAAVREMRSLACAHGIVSACVWDYGGRMEFLRCFWHAAAELDPQARRLDEGVRFPLCRPDALTDLFRSADLRDALCEPLVIRTAFAGFVDYWRPLLGGTGPAPSYVASLDEDRRAKLARNLENALPRRKDGTIELIARAWAVRGIAA
jgi:SAM-dependent methyltransferase